MINKVDGVNKVRDIEKINLNIENSEYIESASVVNIDSKTKDITIKLVPKEGLYDKVLNELMGVASSSKAKLLKIFSELSEGKSEYERVKDALKEAYQTGYSVVMPSIKDMKLENPEIIKQSGRFGVKLKAIASSLHIVKVDVESTFEPIIGSEMQSKELIDNLLGEENIWQSEIFGRSLEKIVEDGVRAKLSTLPDSIRYKLCQTITKIVNKGSSNLIAIVI